MTQVIKPTPDVKVKVVIEAEYTIPATSLLTAYGSTDPQEVAAVDAELWADPMQVGALIFGLQENEVGIENFVSTTVTGEATS